MTHNSQQSVNLTTEQKAAREPPRVKRMRKIVTAYKGYVTSYASESFNFDCQDKTFVLDMLYGIGIAIDKERFYAADGFDRFKAELAELIK